MDNLTYYNQQLEKYKDGPQVVSWGSKESQELRFKILCDIGDLRDKTILDYGCGVGDLCQFLKKYKIREYVGYDINGKMIKRALEKYPDGIFRNYIAIETFDYVFASGTFNLKTTNWEKETYQTLGKIWGLCRLGVAVNFLSSLHQNKNKISYYADPSDILKFIGTLTKKFILRHDYKNNDFTVYLYK